MLDAIFKKDPLKKLCKDVQRDFLVVLENKPFVAVVMLGNLFRALNNPQAQPQHAVIIATLQELKTKLVPLQVQRLWQAAHDIPHEQWSLKDIEVRRSIHEVRLQLIRDLSFVQHIDEKTLIDLGEGGLWYRDVFIALIRKHLASEHQADPFAEEFSFKLLEQGGSGQNSRYVNGFIAKCKSLPIANIGLLGQKKQQIAEFILQDLRGSFEYLHVSKEYVQYHASLREPVAAEWKNYFEDMPLTDAQRAWVVAELKSLQGKYPEFKVVEVGARVNRANHYFDPKYIPLLDKIYLGVGLPPVCAWMATHATGTMAFVQAAAVGAPAVCTKALAISAISSASWCLAPMATLYGVGWAGHKLYQKYRARSEQEEAPTQTPPLRQRAPG